MMVADLFWKLVKTWVSNITIKSCFDFSFRVFASHCTTASLIFKDPYFDDAGGNNQLALVFPCTPTLSSFATPPSLSAFLAWHYSSFWTLMLATMNGPYTSDSWNPEWNWHLFPSNHTGSPKTTLCWQSCSSDYHKTTWIDLNQIIINGYIGVTVNDIPKVNSLIEDLWILLFALYRR